ncbi:MAG: alpha/beta fold hydrolase, partial [Gammaproteobacteria bacterium]
LLLTSERDGHAQLHRLDLSGSPVAGAPDGLALQPLTAGRGRVNRILAVHDAHALVLGWWQTPTEQHVYRVDLARGDAHVPEPVTREPGWHDASASPDGRWVIYRVSSLDLPGALRLLNVVDQTVPVRTIADQSIAATSPYGPLLGAHRRPQLGTLQAEDGQTLHYRLTEPDAQHRPARGAPVIVHVYGGPGVQRVRNEWQPSTVQMLAQHGYGVLELDNRGTGNRTPAFEAPIHGRLGAVEVRDQVRGVEFLRSLDWVDPNRIGVMGHSYGGYMALQCLLTAPEHFRAAIATAPVSDWRLYDTHYTERYLGTPDENPVGYAESGVFVHLERARAPIGRLLLIHGMADDNVLYTHSTRLYRALQAHNQSFDMMAYPGSRHALQEQDVSIHRFTLILDFLARHL